MAAVEAVTAAVFSALEPAGWGLSPKGSQGGGPERGPAVLGASLEAGGVGALERACSQKVTLRKPHLTWGHF